MRLRSKFFIAQPCCISGYEGWLGGKEIGAEGNWVWTDGSDRAAIQIGSSYWLYGEPNDYGGEGL